MTLYYQVRQIIIADNTLHVCYMYLEPSATYIIVDEFNFYPREVASRYRDTQLKVTNICFIFTLRKIAAPHIWEIFTFKKTRQISSAGNTEISL